MIFIDFETYSETPIGWGTYRYASSCEPMIVTYALDDGSIECWDRTLHPHVPEHLLYLIYDTDELLTAHNAMFDRNVLRYGLKINTPIERWRCTMVRAFAHALPGGLDILCGILEIEQELRKLKSGKQMINLFCKPQKFRHSVPKSFGTPKERKAAIAAAEAAWTGRATRLTHPVDWAEFKAYAINDVASMRVLDKKLPRWNYEGEELALYHLDQKINDRGMLVDVDLAQAAVRAVEQAKAELAARTVVLTNEEVESTTKRDQLLAHILRAHGVDLPDLQMSTLERRLNDPNLPPEVRELIAIRLQASSTSTSKYQALLNAAMPDGRLCGTLQFDGAGRTRRWAGRTFQPQNLPSKGLPSHELIDIGIDAMRGGYADFMFGDVMAIASGAIRGCIIAPPKKKLVIADLANIEGRCQAWLAGEEWKLQAFRDYDAGTGPDLYKLAYAKAFRIPIGEVTKEQRQVGKILEQMLGYEGGVGAFVTGAATYDIDLEALAKVAYPALPADMLFAAKEFLDWVRDHGNQTFGLSDEAFITCDALKRMWRRAHPMISTLWKETQRAAVTAVNNPGNTVECRRCKIRVDGAWLRIRLPSGRYLCYPSPRANRGKISYMGINQYSRKWCRIVTYGGKFFENENQSLAGDILKSSMPAVEDAGYEIVLTVHDEVVAEALDTSEFSSEHLSSLLATPPTWALDMPLAAAGFETYRYRKE